VASAARNPPSPIENTAPPVAARTAEPKTPTTEVHPRRLEIDGGEHGRISLSLPAAASTGMLVKLNSSAQSAERSMVQELLLRVAVFVFVHAGIVLGVLAFP
jgi:hypothetical protein